MVSIVEGPTVQHIKFYYCEECRATFAVSLMMHDTSAQFEKIKRLHTKACPAH